MTRLLDPRNERSWDAAPFAGTRRTYVIASTPRTGSTLFANALWDTGRAGAPKEYLNPMQVRDFGVRFGSPPRRLAYRLLDGPLVALAGQTVDDDGMRAHLAQVLAVRTGGNGWFGLKLHHHHFERWWHVVEDVLEPVAWLYVRRQDTLGQAISWELALQTGRWASSQRSWFPPMYSRARIQRRLDAIARAENGWSAFFAARRITPHVVAYEDLAADLDGVVRGALRHLGEPDDAPTVRPSQRPQANAISQDWRARFMTDAFAPAKNQAIGSPHV